MTQIPINCPYCATKHVAATLLAIAVANDTTASAFATCNKCSFGVVLMIQISGLPDAIIFQDELEEPDEDIREALSRMKVLAVAPNAPKPRTIQFIPERVESAYREGEVNRAEKRYLSAAGNYRTALDRALKWIAPDEKGTIYQKVERMASQNVLPSTLIDLMHEIRFLGNQIHDMDDPDPADVEAGADFATLLLTYLFELPGRVTLAAEKRAGAQAPAG